MKGYMNGASTDPEEKMINAPSSKSTATKGMSHHFFSCLRNSKNSLHNCHMTL
jgi:hypothetical protein